MARRARALEGPNVRGAHIQAQGVITAALGDVDDAVRLLQEAFDNGSTHNVWIHRDPAFDDLWGYPPFDSLMRPR